MKRIAMLVGLSVASVASLGGCAEPHSLMVHRPQYASVDAKVTKMWSSDIHGIARTGDWILTRSYYLVADGIALASSGEQLSHASIYDAEKNTVIEAVGDGVREIPLERLVDRNHYIIVVRPGNMTEADGKRAVARARSRIGTAFDIAGMFGFDDKDKVYCSELVWWAAQMEQRTGEHPRVIEPADLIHYGQIVYWSGKRTDEQVMQLAINR